MKRSTRSASANGRWRSSVIVAMVGAVALLGLTAGFALAHNFGSNTAAFNTPAHPCDYSTSSQCVADNGSHLVYLTMLSTDPMYIATTNRFPTYNATDVHMQTVTSASGADVWVLNGNYGDTTWWAYGACSTTATFGGSDPDRWCRPQDIFYNITHPSNWDGTLTGRRAVACHELGHTVGLRHVGSGSCMVSGSKTLITIDSDQISHLNAQY